jgi:hypothetical protein
LLSNIAFNTNPVCAAKKYCLLFFSLLLMLTAARAQLTISGTVYDSTKTIPLQNVLVRSSSGTTDLTDSLGHYDIVARENDSLSFVYNNKSTAEFSINQVQNLGSFDISLRVRVPENKKILKEVIVYAHSYHQDSIENRKEFADGFNFQKPGIGVSSSSYSGTAGLDIDQFIGIFNFRKNRIMRAFQQRLIEEEQEKYIDYRFNKTLVRRMTNLQGADLDAFMIRYRPDFYFTQTSPVVDFYQYILDASYQYKAELLLKTKQ